MAATDDPDLSGEDDNGNIRHARQLLAARGSDPATEAEIAAAAADLLDRAGQGPERAQAEQHQAADRRGSPRSRRVRGRTTATAAPQWPRPAPSPAHSGQEEDSAGGSAGGRRPRPRLAPAEVIALPLFDARKEAEKWW